MDMAVHPLPVLPSDSPRPCPHARRCRRAAPDGLRAPGGSRRAALLRQATLGVCRMTGRREAELAGAAAGYIAVGWPVFPCKPGSKEPDTAHGFKDASTDPDVISAWWRAR